MQEIEKKVQLDFKWLKNWYHFQRKKGDIKKDSWIKSEKLDDDEMSEESTTVANDVIDDVDVIDRSEDDMKDDKTQLVADLQRKFDELQARYNLMAGLLLEKSILKPDTKIGLQLFDFQFLAVGTTALGTGTSSKGLFGLV